MPQLSPLGLLPVSYDVTCWSDECPSDYDDLEQVRLQVCKGCRVARYCSRECQSVDWARHRAQCAQAAALSDVARRSVRPQERMQIVDQDLSDDAIGLLTSDSSVLGAPRWRFMRLTHQLEWLTRHGLHRLTKAQWRIQLARPEVVGALDEVWASAYVGELPGIPMAPAVDDGGSIVVRDIVRSLTARAAIRCVLRLAPLGLVLVLLTRPPRVVREAVREGRLGEGNYSSGFFYTPLTSGKVAASQDWIDIIHLSVVGAATLVT